MRTRAVAWCALAAGLLAAGAASADPSKPWATCDNYFSLTQAGITIDRNDGWNYDTTNHALVADPNWITWEFQTAGTGTIEYGSTVWQLENTDIRAFVVYDTTNWSEAPKDPAQHNSPGWGLAVDGVNPSADPWNRFRNVYRAFEWSGTWSAAADETWCFSVNTGGTRLASGNDDSLYAFHFRDRSNPENTVFMGAQPAPEPASLVLLGCAAGAGALVRRRKRGK